MPEIILQNRIILNVLAGRSCPSTCAYSISNRKNNYNLDKIPRNEIDELQKLT